MVLFSPFGGCGGLLLVLCSGITTDSLREPYWVLGSELRLAVCKTNTLLRYHLAAIFSYSGPHLVVLRTNSWLGTEGLKLKGSIESIGDWRLRIQRRYWGLKIERRSTACKAKALPAVPYLWPIFSPFGWHLQLILFDQWKTIPGGGHGVITSACMGNYAVQALNPGFVYKTLAPKALNTAQSL